MPLDWTQPIWEVVNNPLFEKFIIIVVILNTITMAMQIYDAPAAYHNTLSFCNTTFTVIFNIEMLMKLAALRW